jgi:hypothetical protein
MALPSMQGTGERGLASLVDLDPDIAAALPTKDVPLARRALAGHVVALPAGATAVDGLDGGADAWAAYLISGVVVRSTHVGRVALPELMGPGEIVPPAAVHDGVVPATERLTVVEDAEALVLGRAAAHALARWPEVHAVVEERRDAQRRRTAVLGAIAQLPNVDLRLLAVLWHIAETWGSVGPDGTLVPFPLTHQMLGWFVAAERPTVSLALKRLDGVHRNDDGTWLLAPGSYAVLDALLGGDGPPVDVVLRARGERGRAKERREAASALRNEARQTGRHFRTGR